MRWQDVRTVAVATAGAWGVGAIAAALWTLLTGGPYVDRLGLAALILGAVLMLTSGNLLTRPIGGTSSRAGVRVHGFRNDDVSGCGAVGGITDLGLTVLIGGPLLFGGALLFL